MFGPYIQKNLEEAIQVLESAIQIAERAFNTRVPTDKQIEIAIRVIELIMPEPPVRGRDRRNLER